MPTPTTNYGLNKPLVGSAVDQDLWGQQLNENFDEIDSLLKQLFDSITPPETTGVIKPYAGTNAPAGYLMCYGQAVSRSTYSDLFTICGTTYGIGDGVTTFNIPDLRGRVVAGKDNMGGTSADRLTGQTGGVNGDNLAAVGGAETHTLSTDQMPSHTHGNTLYTAPAGESLGPSSDPGIHVEATITSATGGGGAHNNVQPTIILNYIIKT